MPIARSERSATPHVARSVTWLHMTSGHLLLCTKMSFRSPRCAWRRTCRDSCTFRLVKPTTCTVAQVIAFEFGRDVMERLRGAHPAVSAVMEIMLTDIGATVTCGPHELISVQDIRC